MNVGRVIRTLGAHGFGQGVTVLSTVLIPAIAIRNVGADSYGLILTMTGITQLLLFADLGITLAAANQICLFPANQQDRVSAFVHHIQKIATKNTLLSLTLFIGLLSAYFAVELNHSPNGVEIAVSCLLFGISSALQPVINMYVAAQRHQGHPDKAVYFLNIGRLFTLLSFVIAYAMFENLVVIAACSLAVRALYSAYAIIRSRNYFHGLPDQNTHSSLGEVQTAGHGLAITGALQHLTLHAPVILISLLLGPALAAVYSSARTLSRVAIQPIGIGLASLHHELTILWSQQAFRTFKKLTLLATGISVALLISTSLVTYFFLSEITSVWLSDKLQIPGALFIPAALSATAQAATLAISQSLGAINRTQHLSRLLLINTFAAIGAGYLALVYTKNMVTMSYMIGVLELLITPLLFKELQNSTKNK